MTDELVDIADFEVCTTPDWPSAPVPPALTANQMAAIAREMAMNVRGADVVLRAAGITKGQFENYVVVHPYYKRCYETFVVEWESALSTNKRIAIEAAAALEDTLPYLIARMQDDKEPLNQATETAKLFTKLAGAGETTGANAVGEKFSISIILGPETIHKTIEGSAVQAPVEVEAGNTAGRISLPNLTAREKT